MGTGAKIAIGCGVALVLAGTAAVVGVFGVAYWGKRKLERATEREHRIDGLREKANAHPFEPSRDGALDEARLMKFLEVRKRVLPVYERYRERLEALGPDRQPALRDVTQAYTMITDLRTAQAEAQADVGMSEDEYRYFVEQVYKTAWAAEVARAAGRAPSEAAAEALERAAEQVESAGKAAGETAAGDEAKEALGEQSETLRQQAEAVRNQAETLDGHPANIALFKKHEAEIRKYAMSGLEWIGL